MGAYADAIRASQDDPDRFWLAAAEAIDWSTPPRTGLDAGRPPFYRWFADGVLNTCYNALDRHVEAGFGDTTALIYNSPVTRQRGSLQLFGAAYRGGPVRRRAGPARRRQG
jgi:propionyl-CoA synthetase